MNRPRAGQKALLRFLGVQANFYGVTGQFNIVLSRRQRLTSGHSQLPFHQVQPGHHFRHRVLDLKASVHLQEIKIPALVQQELYRARTHVTDGTGSLHRSRTHRCPQFLGHNRAR